VGVNHGQAAGAENIPVAYGIDESDYDNKASTLHVSGAEVIMGDMSKIEFASSLDDSEQGSVHASKLAGANLKEPAPIGSSSVFGGCGMLFVAVGVVVVAVVVVCVALKVVAGGSSSSSTHTGWQGEPWAYETMLSSLSVELYNETHTSAVMGLSPAFTPYNTAGNDYSLAVVRDNPTYPTKNLKLSFRVGHRGPGGAASGRAQIQETRCTLKSANGYNLRSCSVIFSPGSNSTEGVVTMLQLTSGKTIVRLTVISANQMSTAQSKMTIDLQNSKVVPAASGNATAPTSVVKASITLGGLDSSSFDTAAQSAFSNALSSTLSVPADSIHITGITNSGSRRSDNSDHRRSGGGVIVAFEIRGLAERASNSDGRSGGSTLGPSAIQVADALQVATASSGTTGSSPLVTALQAKGVSTTGVVLSSLPIVEVSAASSPTENNPPATPAPTPPPTPIPTVSPPITPPGPLSEILTPVPTHSPTPVPTLAPLNESSWGLVNQTSVGFATGANNCTASATPAVASSVYDAITQTLSISASDLLASQSSFLRTVLGTSSLTFANINNCQVSTGRRSITTGGSTTTTGGTLRRSGASDALGVVAAFDLNTASDFATSFGARSFGLSSADAVIMLLGENESWNTTIKGLAIGVKSNVTVSLADLLPVELGSETSWMSDVTVEAGAVISLSTNGFTMSEAVGFLSAGNTIGDGLSFKGTITVQPGKLKELIESFFRGHVPTSLPVDTRIPYESFFSVQNISSRRDGVQDEINRVATKANEMITTIKGMGYEDGIAFAEKEGLNSGTLAGVDFTVTSVAGLPSVQLDTTLAVPTPGGSPSTTLPFKLTGLVKKNDATGAWDVTATGGLQSPWTSPFNTTWIDITTLSAVMAFSCKVNLTDPTVSASLTSLSMVASAVLRIGGVTSTASINLNRPKEAVWTATASLVGSLNLGELYTTQVNPTGDSSQPPECLNDVTVSDLVLIVHTGDCGSDATCFEGVRLDGSLLLGATNVAARALNNFGESRSFLMPFKFKMPFLETSVGTQGGASVLELTSISPFGPVELLSKALTSRPP